MHSSFVTFFWLKLGNKPVADKLWNGMHEHFWSVGCWWTNENTSSGFCSGFFNGFTFPFECVCQPIETKIREITFNCYIRLILHQFGLIKCEHPKLRCKFLCRLLSVLFSFFCNKKIQFILLTFHNDCQMFCKNPRFHQLFYNYSKRISQRISDDKFKHSTWLRWPEYAILLNIIIPVDLYRTVFIGECTVFLFQWYSFWNFSHPIF